MMINKKRIKGIVAAFLIIASSILIIGCSSSDKIIASGDSAYSADSILGDVHEVDIKESSYEAIIEDNRWKDLVNGIGITIVISFSSFIIGTILGFVFYYLYFLDIKFVSKAVRGLERFFMFIPDTTALLISYFIFFGMKPGVNVPAAIFALSMIFAFATFRAIEGSVDSMDQGGKDAAVSMGYSPFNALFKIYFPHGFENFLGTYQEATKELVGKTSMVGIISIMDVQAIASGIAEQTMEPIIPLLITSVVYVALGVLGYYLLGLLRNVYKTNRTEEEIKNRIEKGQL